MARLCPSRIALVLNSITTTCCLASCSSRRACCSRSCRNSISPLRSARLPSSVSRLSSVSWLGFGSFVVCATSTVKILQVSPALGVWWVLFQSDRRSRLHHLLLAPGWAVEKPGIRCVAPTFDTLTRVIVCAMSTEGCEQKLVLLDGMFGGFRPGTGRSKVMLGS